MVAWSTLPVLVLRLGVGVVLADESSSSSPLSGLCAMYKNFPAFQVGCVTGSTGALTTVANLTGLEAISQGVCFFAEGLFVTASDDVSQENQLFVVELDGPDSAARSSSSAAVPGAAAYFLLFGRFCHIFTQDRCMLTDFG